MITTQRALLGRGLPSCLLLAFFFLACAGCASTTEQPLSERDQAAMVTGAWRYETDGSNVLGQGVFFIERERGRYVGVMRDSRQGQVPLRIRVHNRMLTLNVSDISVRGHVEENQFTAFVDQNLWDVSISASARQRNHVKGVLRAKRVNAGYTPSIDLDAGCSNPLYEHDYTCEK